MKRILAAIGFAVLGITLLLVAGREVWAVVPAGDQRPSWHVQEQTSTVYLPLVVRRYDPTYVSPFGIVMYGRVDDASGLQVMKDAGSKWVTTILRWSDIESTEGSYDWSSFDTKAQNAQAAGMEVFVLFTGNPPWAAALPGGPVTDTQDLVSFVTMMVERYDCDGVNDAPGSPCVHYWSFYAEPDNGDINRARAGKGYWGHDGAGYAAMLSQVSPAIHAASPRAKVLIGGIAYDYFEPDGPFVRSFLTDTLSALNTYPGGAGAYIDAVAFHYYPINPAWSSIREKAMEIRSIMERHGVGDLPMICPEMGYWSAEEAGSSEAIQARRLVQMFVRGISVGLEHMSWFTVFDASPEQVAQYPTEEHGLFPYNDLTHPKQSYYAYQTLTQELYGARYLQPLGTSNAEGYVFQTLDGYEKTVLWATVSSTSVSFPYSCLRLVDTTGNVYSPVYDGDPTWDWDGTVNGEIALGVYRDTPFYVEPCH
ncbi:MAG TPA: hypothetical protein G4O00_09650 [Thermoflexia bacterium]|jgi:hypothetical protein|nr:hypothetical protein [Thermoflexia bacterium]